MSRQIKFDPRFSLHPYWKTKKFLWHIPFSSSSSSTFATFFYSPSCSSSSSWSSSSWSSSSPSSSWSSSLSLSLSSSPLPSSPPLSVLFLLLCLPFLLSFLSAATAVRNSNRGSIWRHPVGAGRHYCVRVDCSHPKTSFSTSLHLTLFRLTASLPFPLSLSHSVVRNFLRVLPCPLSRTFRVFPFSSLSLIPAFVNRAPWPVSILSLSSTFPGDALPPRKFSFSLSFLSSRPVLLHASLVSFSLRNRRRYLTNLKLP